jgi:hypothetical protein
MNTETGNNRSEQFQTAVNTSTHPEPIHTPPSQAPFISSGTIGHTGAVRYSKAVAAVVNETYVVANKK